MKRKRLNRDLKWGFQNFPYYQVRVDIPEFSGLACLIQITDGKYRYWRLPIAKKAAVCGKGMVWLQLIPDGKKHVVTAKYIPKGKFLNGVHLPYTVSVWYADVIEGIEYDDDGVAAFIDKYLDVIFTTQGDIMIDDRNELDYALQCGHITAEQHESALYECDLIIRQWCRDTAKTELLCAKVLSYVTDKIGKG